MESKEIKYASWITDLLNAANVNPGYKSEELLLQCGRGCAMRKGAIEGVKQLRELAKGCASIADYVAFFKETLHINAIEEPGAIVLKLGKPHCTCPMMPDVGNEILCNCTRGHEIAVWSMFFGKPIDAEIVESHLRGGKDCVIRLKLKN